MKSLKFISFVLSLCTVATLSGQKLRPAAQVALAQKANKEIPEISLFKVQTGLQPRFDRICDKVTTATILVDKLNEANVENLKEMRLTIPYNGENLAVDLVEVPTFTDDFQVQTSESNGKAVPYEKGKFYRGILKGDNKSVAAFSIFKDEIIGLVSSDNMGNIVVAKTDNSAKEYVIYSDRDLKVTVPSACGTPDEPEMSPFDTRLSAPPQELINKCARVYIETDYAMYVNKGSVAAATNYITAIFNNAASIYQNESISTTISSVYVWTTQDSYSKTDSYGALTQFKALRPTFNGDLAHLVALGGQNIGGVAWLDALCSTGYRYAYSNVSATYQNFPTYSWSVMVVTHEMGHNLGSPHTHSCTWPGGPIDNCYTSEGGCAAGPAPVNGGTVMSYCHLTSNGINLNNGFGPLPGARIRDRVTNAACLAAGTCSGGSTNTPPTVSITSPVNNASYVTPASITINATAADVGGSITQVQFYNGTTLLGTDNTSPYSFLWSNVPAGTYSLTAKATDNGGATTTSTVVSVRVNSTSTLDAGISAIGTPNGAVTSASVTPVITLRNFGTVTLTSATITFRVDNNTNSTYNWSGSLAAAATINVTLPSVTYAAGSHTFTASTTTVNGGTDANSANNSATSNFSYTVSTCNANAYETNNTSATASVIPLNTTVSAAIGVSGDRDYYKFSTTAAAPKVKITLTNLPFDFDVVLYSVSATGTLTRLGSSVNGSTTSEAITYNSPTSAANYIVYVYGYGGAYSAGNCYNLLATTSATNLLIEDNLPPTLPVTKKEGIDFKIYPNPANSIVNLNLSIEKEGEYTLTLMDMLGRTQQTEVLNLNAGDSHQIFKVNDLAKGIYIVNLSNENNSITRKFLKE